MQTKFDIFFLNGKGAAERGTTASIENFSGLIWVRLAPDNIETFFKSVAYNFPPLVADFLSAEETRPRMLTCQDGLLATYRGINFNPGQELEDMVSIRLWMQSHFIITVQHRRLISADAIQESLLAGEGPKSSAEFLEQLLDSLTDKSTNIVSSLSEQLDCIEDLDVPKQQQQENHDILSTLRRRIILLYRYLYPQYEAINSFSVNKLTWLSEDKVNNLKEIANINRLLVENIQAERERAKVIQEEYATLEQKLLNRKMYLIAIVTAIFMPLTFITGLFGVNLGGIPGANTNHAFLILIIVLALVGLFQVIQLKKRGWF